MNIKENIKKYFTENEWSFADDDSNMRSRCRVCKKDNVVLFNFKTGKYSCENNCYPPGEIHDYLPKGWIPSDSENSTLKISTCQELLDYEVQPEYFIVNPLIPEQAITSITADSGKGKSLLALIFAYSIATGEKLFDQFEVKQNKVLIVDMEMSTNEIITRFKKIVTTEVPIDYIYNQQFLITDDENFENLIEIIEKNKYGVVIFDTFNMISNKKENDQDEMREVNRKLLELIRKTSVTIIYLHHHRKLQKGERLSQSSSRGSTEIIARVSSHLLLDSKSYVEDSNNILEITISQEKARSSERLNGKIGVKIINDNITNKITLGYLGEVVEKTKKVEEAKKAILEILGTENSLTVKQAEEKIPGIGTNNIRTAFKELEEESRINFSKEGRKNSYFLIT